MLQCYSYVAMCHVEYSNDICMKHDETLKTKKTVEHVQKKKQIHQYC